MAFISSIRSLGRIFGSKGATKTVAAVKPVVEGTRVLPSVPGVTRLERKLGGNLFVSETRTLADGSKKTSMMVYGSNGEYIGKGGDQGLAIFREKTIARERGGSILGGDRVTINKNYHETMSTTRHTENIVKDYTADGILEHAETTTKYRHWTNPKSTVFDRSKTLSGETLYSQTVASKKAAEAAAKREAEAAAEAARLAEQEAAKKLAVSRPRVNVGKVFNRNLDEFKCVEEVKPDGTIIRRYFDPMASNSTSHPLITTMDKGLLHEEIIYDTRKGLKLNFKQLGDGEPEYSLQKGLQYRQTSRMAKDEYGSMFRQNTQVYDDGLNHVEFGGDHYPGRFKLNVKNPQYQPGSQFDWAKDEYISFRDRGYVHQYDLYRPKSQFDIDAQAKLDRLTAEAKSEYIDLEDLFKPYQA